jgi:hypothetical protein
MMLIGLGHKARQGKDTVAKEIVKLCGKEGIYAKQYAFSDALKAYCRVAYGMEEKNSKLLQLVGTDLFRVHVASDIWVGILTNQLEEEDVEVAVISDVRFKNETLMFHNNHLDLNRRYLIKVSRPGFVVTDRVSNHESETSLDNFHWDYTIINDGSLEDLRYKVRTLMLNNIIGSI